MTPLCGPRLPQRWACRVRTISIGAFPLPSANHSQLVRRGGVGANHHPAFSHGRPPPSKAHATPSEPHTEKQHQDSQAARTAVPRSAMKIAPRHIGGPPQSGNDLMTRGRNHSKQRFDCGLVRSFCGSSVRRSHTPISRRKDARKGRAAPMTNQARQTRDSSHSCAYASMLFSPAPPLSLQKLGILSGGPPCLGFVVPGISLRLPLRWRSLPCP